MRNKVAKVLRKKAYKLCPYPDKENRIKTHNPLQYTEESPISIYRRLKKEYKNGNR